MANYLKVGYVEVRQTETTKIGNQQHKESLLIIDDAVQWSCNEPILSVLYKELHDIGILGVDSCNVLVDKEQTTSKATVIVNEEVRCKLQNIIKIYVGKLQEIEVNVPLSEDIKRILRSLAVLTKALDCCFMESEKNIDERKKLLILTADF